MSHQVRWRSTRYATAKTHVSRLLTKLGVRDRAQLVVLAYEAGLGGRDMAVCWS